MPLGAAKFSDHQVVNAASRADTATWERSLEIVAVKSNIPAVHVCRSPCPMASPDSLSKYSAVVCACVATGTAVRHTPSTTCSRLGWKPIECREKTENSTANCSAGQIGGP